MKLSCITTTYNEGETLLVSVNSVLNQTFTDFEYIIVDDGSVDDTLDVLSRLDDPRIKILRQANDGLSSARNRALEHVQGEYICFLDADDSRPNWAFQVIADEIERSDPDVIMCAGTLSEVRGELLPFYDKKYFDLLADVAAPEAWPLTAGAQKMIRPLAQLIEPQSANKVVRSSFLKAHGIGYPNTHFFEDIFFHTNILAAAQKLAFIRTPCFSYFRRYSRPQITNRVGDTRFDILAVSKLTLETFARYPEFHEPLYRTCVVASCAKLIEWCENSIGHQHRFSFRQAARGMLGMIDPLYLNFPQNMPVELEELTGAKTYLKGLVNAA